MLAFWWTPEMCSKVNLTDAMYPQDRGRSDGPIFIAVFLEQPFSRAWMMVLQTFFEIIFHVDRVRVKPCDQSTVLFGLIAARRLFSKASHTDCCVVSNPVDVA